MRLLAAFAAACCAIFLNGCAVLEKEISNRGGYLDYLADERWMKADSKGLRALRAFAIQVSLARIASVSAKNDSDRQLLAIRIGALTKRFLPIYACAFNTNPLGVAGSKNEPCFYYDSAMVEYTTGLFDLAMVALPVEDGRKLVNTVTGSFVNPLNITDLLDALITIGKDALKYGRVVGALYRDTVELEVQLWLATPAIDDRPPPYRVTDADVAELKAIYARRNDDMPAWLGAIEALRARGLEPLPHPRFFEELGGLMKYLCDQITQQKAASDSCKVGWTPVTLPPPSPVLSSAVPMRVQPVVNSSGAGPAVQVAVSTPNGRSGQAATQKNLQNIAALQAQYDIVKTSLSQETKRLSDMRTAFAGLPIDAPGRTELLNNINRSVTQINALNKQAADLKKQAAPATLK